MSNATHESAPPAVIAPEYDQHTREAVLRQLLPNSYDYEYARDSGLIDMFYYNPERHIDGLVHTLAGDFMPGTTIPRGFHHGPSGAALWPSVRRPDGTAEPSTRKEPEKGQVFYPMEPAHSYVVVGGMQKTLRQKNQATGEERIERGKFGMYPDEYDALAVMQAIRLARDNRDKSKDKRREATEAQGATIITEGKVPLINGTSSMTIRMALDAETGKVISAYPKTRSGKIIMGLTQEKMWEHILTPTPAPPRST